MTIHYRGMPTTKTLSQQDYSVVAPTHATGFYRDFLKPLLDAALVLASAVFVAPLIAFLALCIWSEDRKSPFYSQKRIGKDGRTFTMWKLRTMIADADKVLDAYLDQNPAARAEWEDKQKLDNDPRITKWGRILRKTSLDELPQLWNVVKGDMSLVGPRPMMPKQKVLYPGAAYFELRPGVTGFWQITDRSIGTFAGRARFDDAYDRQISLWTDMVVLAKTVLIVVRCTGR